MAESIEQRACQLAVYMIETGATVRAAANHFGISKSTVHKEASKDNYRTDADGLQSCRNMPCRKEKS